MGDFCRGFHFGLLCAIGFKKIVFLNCAYVVMYFFMGFR